MPIPDGSDQSILEDLNIVQGTQIHLQDSRLANAAKVSKSDIDWAKMTLQKEVKGEDGLESQQRDTAQIDLMLLKFIEYH